MVIKIGIDLSSDWDRELLEHMAECGAHQASLYAELQMSLVSALSHAYHLNREYIEVSIGIPEPDDHSMMLIDDLTNEERERFEQVIEEYRRAVDAQRIHYRSANTA